MLTEVKLQPNGNAVRVGIEFGHTRVGGYRMNVWTPRVPEPREFGRGSNEDAIPDEFYTGHTAEEHISTPHPISITAGVHAVVPINGQPDPSGPWNMLVHISQDDPATGQSIPSPDSPFLFEGNLQNGTAAILEHFKFV